MCCVVKIQHGNERDILEYFLKPPFLKKIKTNHVKFFIATKIDHEPFKTALPGIPFESDGQF